MRRELLAHMRHGRGAEVRKQHRQRVQNGCACTSAEARACVPTKSISREYLASLIHKRSLSLSFSAPRFPPFADCQRGGRFFERVEHVAALVDEPQILLHCSSLRECAVKLKSIHPSASGARRGAAAASSTAGGASNALPLHRLPLSAAGATPPSTPHTPEPAAHARARAAERAAASIVSLPFRESRGSQRDGVRAEENGEGRTSTRLRGTLGWSAPYSTCASLLTCDEVTYQTVPPFI